MYCYDSSYLHYAGKTLDWLPMDTEQRYRQHLETHYEDLKNNGWINKTFTYKFNSLGFRCNEFAQDNNIMFLGCSHTIGIGLPIETIWPELVSKELKMNCVNLAIGGGSCDTAFRLCHGYIDRIKPKIIIMLEPPHTRMEIIENSKIDNIIFSNPTSDAFLKKWVANENNSWFNKEKNILAIQMMCEHQKTKFKKITTDDFGPFDDLARDLAHAGIKSHAKLAGKILTTL